MYHSKRVDGKVISEYRGQNITKKPFKKKKLLLTFALAFIVVLMIGVLYYSKPFTGRSILTLESHKVGEAYTGQVKLILHGGEMIPKDSIVTITNEGNVYNYTLSELIDETPTEGQFYLEESTISGTGEGYGLVGQKETLVPVYFKLEITSEETSSGSETFPVVEENVTTNETSIGAPVVEENVTPTEEVPVEETPIEEVPVEETPTETTTQTIPVETTTEVIPEETVTKIQTSPITGNVVSNALRGFFGRITGRVTNEPIIIQGDVVKGDEFKYSINSGETATIVKDSVRTEEGDLSEDVLELETTENEVIVRTNYSLIEEGFGNEYITEENKTYLIDFDKLGINLVQGNLEIKLNYNNNDFLTFEGNVEETTTQPEEPMETINVTTNETFEEIVNETFNFTEEVVNLSLTDEEKNVLKNKFGFIVVSTSSKNYRDKIIVEFTLGDMILENAYDASLGEEKIKELIERDKILWLKDIANEITKSIPLETQNLDFDSMETIE